ncbi:hypothetical protein ALC56_08643, partial [Trachymyrmex septentrionalis]
VAATTTGGTTSGSPAPSATAESTTFLTFMDSALLSDELSGSPFCAAASSFVVSFDGPSFSPLLCNLSSNTGTSVFPFCVVPLSFCFSESTVVLSFVSTTFSSFTVSSSFIVSCCVVSFSHLSASVVSVSIVWAFSSAFSDSAIISEFFSADTSVDAVASFLTSVTVSSVSVTASDTVVFSAVVSVASPFSVTSTVVSIFVTSCSLFAKIFSLSDVSETIFDSSFTSSFFAVKHSSDFFAIFLSQVCDCGTMLSAFSSLSIVSVLSTSSTCVSFVTSVESSIFFSEDVIVVSDFDADSGTDTSMESSATGVISVAVVSKFSSVFSAMSLSLSFVASMTSSFTSLFAFSEEPDSSFVLSSDLTLDSVIFCSVFEMSFSSTPDSSTCSDEIEVLSDGWSFAHSFSIDSVTSFASFFSTFLSLTLDISTSSEVSIGSLTSAVPSSTLSSVVSIFCRFVDD